MKPFWVPLALIVAMIVTAAVFAIAPGLDLAAAAVFYKGHGTFVAETPLGNAVRRVVYWVPAVLAALLTLLYLARRFGLTQVWAPTGRGVAVLLLTFAIGPGLIANVLLKNHSHRPRPYQTIEFGGNEPFRPFDRFDGACKRNCSFVSGEGSAAFWTIVPALLIPPPLQTGALAASLVFGAGVAGLRMAFGAHYLSDTLFAALFTWFASWLVWVLVRPGSVARPTRLATLRPSGPQGAGQGH